MVVLVDDVGKAREWLNAEATAAGLVLVPVEPRFAGNEVTLDVSTLDDYLALARKLGAPALYLFELRRKNPAGAALRLALDEDESELADDPDPEIAAGMRRIVESFAAGHAPEFRLMFLAGGVFHHVRVADKVAWPALSRILRDDEEDVDRHAMDDMEPHEIAELIVAHLMEQVPSRADRQRGTEKLVLAAANELFDSPDDLCETGRENIGQALMIAQVMLRAPDKPRSRRKR